MKRCLFLLVILLPLAMLAQESPKGLEVNHRAPDFSAVDQAGHKISLQQLLTKGKVVLVFYRGQWCPFCNRQLKALEDSLSFIIGKGASLVAVTPEIPDNINKTIDKTRASYPILFDEGLQIMKAYDVAFAVDEKTVERYKKFGLDLAANNGSNGANLPVPAVYVIDSKGTIVYRHFDPDYRKRASVAEITAHL